MIIQFPDGTAIHSSFIASLSMSKAEDKWPGRIQIYTFQEGGGLMSFSSRPVARHFATVMIGTDEETQTVLKRITAQWMGLPEPTDETIAATVTG